VIEPCTCSRSCKNGSAQPIYGSKAHAAAMQQMLRIFPNMLVNTPYPIRFGDGDWITVVTHATGTFTGQMPPPTAR
jgi:SnoaL-like polyketide cyclase